MERENMGSRLVKNEDGQTLHILNALSLADTAVLVWHP